MMGSGGCLAAPASVGEGEQNKVFSLDMTVQPDFRLEIDSKDYKDYGYIRKRLAYIPIRAKGSGDFIGQFDLNVLTTNFYGKTAVGLKDPSTGGVVRVLFTMDTDWIPRGFFQYQQKDGQLTETSKCLENISVYHSAKHFRLAYEASNRQITWSVYDSDWNRIYRSDPFALPADFKPGSLWLFADAMNPPGGSDIRYDAGKRAILLRSYVGQEWHYEYLSEVSLSTFAFRWLDR